MKYERRRKTIRNQEILKLYRERTDLTLKEIGKLFGITSSRVHKIVTRAKELEAEKGE